MLEVSKASIDGSTHYSPPELVIVPEPGWVLGVDVSVHPEWPAVSHAFASLPLAAVFESHSSVGTTVVY